MSSELGKQSLSDVSTTYNQYMFFTTYSSYNKYTVAFFPPYSWFSGNCFLFFCPKGNSLLEIHPFSHSSMVMWGRVQHIIIQPNQGDSFSFSYVCETTRTMWPHTSGNWQWSCYNRKKRSASKSKGSRLRVSKKNGGRISNQPFQQEDPGHGILFGKLGNLSGLVHASLLLEAENFQPSKRAKKHTQNSIFKTSNLLVPVVGC